MKSISMTQRAALIAIAKSRQPAKPPATVSAQTVRSLVTRKLVKRLGVDRSDVVATKAGRDLLRAQRPRNAARV